MTALARLAANLNQLTRLANEGQRVVVADGLLVAGKTKRLRLELLGVGIECEVMYRGIRERAFRFMGAAFPWLQLDRKLRFHVAECTVPTPMTSFGRFGIVADLPKPEVIAVNCYRMVETKSGRKPQFFPGKQYVECYIIRNGVCVARDRIPMPIMET